MGVNIAIDGPAGAGKSTIARLLAKKLGYIYVDTGAMYRALTLYMLENDVDTDSEEAVAAACPDADVKIRYENGEQTVLLQGENVNTRIRTERVSQQTSKVAAMPAVRAKLLGLQRDLAAAEDVIMDGRDIGTNVLPNADVKIYLTADAHVRALRRYLEQTEKGEACVLEEIEKEIIERDHRDMTRVEAPLCQAPDAILVDTSEMDIPQVTAALEQIVQDRLSAEKDR